jgi:hypothetical protein
MGGRRGNRKLVARGAGRDDQPEAFAGAAVVPRLHRIEPVRGPDPVSGAISEGYAGVTRILTNTAPTVKGRDMSEAKMRVLSASELKQAKAEKWAARDKADAAMYGQANMDISEMVRAFDLLARRCTEAIDALYDDDLDRARAVLEAVEVFSSLAAERAKLLACHMLPRATP